jgi:2-dehydro-3-deoxy-D-gluconate 5-dehydrogenase
MENIFSLHNKTALVTGCNKGIGKAMAIGLAQAGANIIGVSANLPLQNSDVENQVKALGVNFSAYQCNLANRDSLYSFINEVTTKHTIDILVNNAGTILRNPAAEHSDVFWDDVIDLNLNTPFILAREIGKQMIENKSGKIIFTCSLLSFQGGINVPGYAASKGALASLIKALANEWASKGINVNGIAPGYIETDNTKDLRNDPDRSASILSRIPAGRWGNVNDFVGPTVFLASAASNYVHGTIVTVDGGWMGR